MGLDCISNHQHMLDMEAGLIKPNPLFKGLRLTNDAKFQLQALRDAHSKQMEEAGYTYLAGGEYDCQWCVWVYKDYLALAQAQLEYQSNISTHQLAKDLGLDELPEGAVINSGLF